MLDRVKIGVNLFPQIMGSVRPVRCGPIFEVGLLRPVVRRVCCCPTDLQLADLAVSEEGGRNKRTDELRP